jgi:hypothetical protein
MSLQAVVAVRETQSAGRSPITSALSPPGVAVDIVDPRRGSTWDRLVLCHPEATLFHSAAWAKTLCKTYRHEPLYLHFSEAGATLALVPLMEVQSRFTGRRGVCLPFSDLCGPLVFHEKAWPHLQDKLSQLVRERRWKYCELRAGLTHPGWAPAKIFYGHKLDLRIGTQELFSRCASSVCRAIRKASKNGLKVGVSTSEEAIRDFYRLHVMTRRRHGLPPQPWSFFLHIHDEVIKRQLGFVVLARNGSRAVAGAVFFHFNKKGLYKFGASEQEARELRGNNLVMWEGIRFLTEQGFETLHFGRTSLDNDGLRHFKLSWGADEEIIKYSRFPVATVRSTARRESVQPLHLRIFRKMPLALNRLAGTIIYPHLD